MQVPDLIAVLGTGLVVAAGVGAERAGGRNPPSRVALPRLSAPWTRT